VENWDFTAVLPEYARRCSAYVRERAGHERPFFLYFSMPSPHTPIAPDGEWQGRSGVSDYADFLLETDWAAGEVLRALEESGQAENTCVIFTCDNGTSPKCDFPQLEAKDVHLREHWRGHKADAYDGGHRVPFIVRWPGHGKAGTRSREPISLADVMATVADVIDFELPDTAAEDSRSVLPLVRGGKLDEPLHEIVVHHSSEGCFAVRRGRWKLLLCHGSGGWSAPNERQARKQGLPPVQLYDMVADPREQHNLQAKHPEIVRELTAELRRIVEAGRSTPGPVQPNHGGATWWNGLPWPRPESTKGTGAADSR
jgi:arylsulfatase A-like enzyme